MIQIPPLRDTSREDAKLFPKGCVYDFDAELIRSLNRQISKRPEVWGMGLWPDDMAEQIAKFFARFCEDTTPEIFRAAFVPEDPIALINSFDGCLGFGALSRMKDAAVMYFGCRPFTDEEVCMLANQTFGDFILAVRSRMAQMPSAEEPRCKSDVSQARLDTLEVYEKESAWRRFAPWAIAFVLAAVFTYACYLRRMWAIVPGIALCIFGSVNSYSWIKTKRGG